MKLAVIMIHYGNKELTRTSLQKIRSKLSGYSVIVVNNTQQDISDLTRLYPHITGIDNHANFGFAKAVNIGIRKAISMDTYDAFLVLNNDLELSFGSIHDLEQVFVQKTSAGIVAPVLHHHNIYDWGGRINKWSGLVRHLNFEQKPKTILSVSHVAGAAVLISKKLIDKIGFFDERFFLYYEDVDYCLRALKADFTIHINPAVVAEHVGSASTDTKKRLLYNWRSHIQFVTKYIPVTILPTAYMSDIVYYPLVFLLSFFT